jgi:hypothetical protein
MQTELVGATLVDARWCLEEGMMRKILCAVLLATLLRPAWGEATTKLSSLQSPRTVFIIGPGTIVSVHRLDLPFLEAHYAVKYKTDDGQMIEVWSPGKNMQLLEGMHGELTYSIHPERIISFRLVGQRVDPSSR